jgi:hypothetical protein
MSNTRSPIAEVLRPIPNLTRAKTKAIPSGYEISTPAKNYRLRLPKNCDGLDFLMAVVRNPKIDLDVRIECAVAALPYQKPRLVAFVQQGNVNPNEMRLVIQGGLPKLPGTSTVFPGDPPRPSPPAHPSKLVEAEPVEVGTCTISAAELTYRKMCSWRNGYIEFIEEFIVV